VRMVLVAVSGRGSAVSYVSLAFTFGLFVL
jgi:hypothetical protein